MLRVREVGESQEEDEEGSIVEECVRVLQPLEEEGGLLVQAPVVQAPVEGFVSDDYHFEYTVRFPCGERQTTGMKQAEALVGGEEKERRESDEGSNDEEAAAAVADLASTVAKKRIANAAAEKTVRKIARDMTPGYEPIDAATKTAQISAKMAAKLRPLVKTMVEAGREWAKVHADTGRRASRKGCGGKAKY